MKSRAPLFDRLVEHAQSNLISLHVPGHKFGQGLESEAAAYYSDVMAIDATEITGMDDLHHPEESILEAQQLAAACFGAGETHFLVGGSTVGNLAMVMSLCRPGDILIVQRNVHKSVIHGLMLASAQAVFVDPGYEEESGRTLGVDIQDIREALERYPQAKGVLLTNPNYYGMGIDLRAMADMVHDYDIPLLIDEAHGAHYGFHADLPESALTAGADIVVQSTHKMLSAMTMGAMLHIQGTRIDRRIIKQRLAMLQSSSPSYPLMASIDLARLEIDTRGEQLIGQGLEVIHYFCKQMSKYPRFRIYQGDGSYTQDPFKITVTDTSRILSGPALAQALEQRGCYPEMSDLNHVLLLFTLHSTMEDAERVVRAFEDMESEMNEAIHAIDETTCQLEAKRVESLRINKENSIRLSQPVQFDSFPIFEEQYEIVELSQAIGRKSAEMIIPYPPGIPIVYTGEIITSDIAAYIQLLIEANVRIQGSEVGNTRMVNVIK
ncbi:aminotransferase class I/II-fold pyridoxal phosphate-dependent enzyme [Paenibacillus sp. N1-5-1-14]|uniref:aminotransferase class I/II-fold pyridoxal phosphate-dependent enzyme n=1 Tax=Paenibacillus radicibacter TaxID=2972488 RepID=UPI002159A0C7|nr:aminotransferase class I/II-fold pyridoxal phosphate-dependent enzyme [Paenibacillus radicibacter]MCR8645891.1 aminotransferase class I/II-fold pyridoxal phosphate-dependent enzyme [Paenibacillus radicibacter]MCR8646026.1 aminotransferase class I/II-fold pyridoxal phosphate-dependent enzyme [Paenibacillus radicibacter]